MMTIRGLLVVFLAVLMAFAGVPSASAEQRHVVDPAAIASTIGGQLASQDADRAVVREALARPEVQSVAREMGVDLKRADAAIGTLAGADLARAASAARQVNGALTGGASTVVISTTTLIIILLVVILLIVALK